MEGLGPQDAPGDCRATRASDNGAFAAHYREIYPDLWVIAAGIASPAAAADIVQQAAAQALAKQQEFEPGSNFKAWMAQFVRYVALNHVRAQQRHATAPLMESDAPAAPPSQQDGLPAKLQERGELPDDQAWFDDAVTRALRSLPETQRACLLLRTVQEMSYAEISQTLGIPEGTAMSHVHRSRRYLREKLRHYASNAGTNRDREL